MKTNLYDCPINRGLNHQSKYLLIELLAYRMLGHKKVKLSRNNAEYKNYKNSLNNYIKNKNDFINFGNRLLYKYYFKEKDFDLVFYYTKLGVIYDYLLEQYAYKNGNLNISVKDGDVVIDAGACWGNSALYFSSKAGVSGKVYSFEFIPNNIALFKKNMELNPKNNSNIKLIDKPLWNVQGDDIYIQDHGPGSHITFEKPENFVGTVKTTTIDDTVLSENMNKLDFIAMDIEGAELNALKGAEKTIKKFKPNLAISVYHNLNDFVDIPKWIDGLKLGYKFFLGHYSIYSEETILFATIK